MAIPGTWTLFYDWGCDGSYSQTSITFNANGTFSTGSGNSGNWSQGSGMILWKYSTSNTCYGGNFASQAMVGISSTFGGLNGCWYATQSTANLLSATELKGQMDDSGGTGRQQK